MSITPAMNKGIWAGLVAIAFVAGSITTGTVAFAAPQQHTPAAFFDVFFDNFETVDSFFDVFFEVETQVDKNTDTIQTEIIALDLHSADPAAHHDPSGGGVTLGSLDCTNGQIAKVVKGGSWACSTDSDQQRLQFDIENLDVVVPAGRTQGFHVICPPEHFVIDHGYSGLDPGNEITNDFPIFFQNTIRHFWEIQNNGETDDSIRLAIVCARLN